MKIKIPIGDWSCDGHCKSEDFVFISNKTVEQIRQAYKDSCKLTGLSFNHNQDYTGLNLGYGTDRQIATEYGSFALSTLAQEILNKFKIDYSDYEDEATADNFVNLLINFIKLSLPDLILEEASFKKSELKSIPAVNGYWNDQLNCQFGYGLFE